MTIFFPVPIKVYSCWQLGSTIFWETHIKLWTADTYSLLCGTNVDKINHKDKTTKEDFYRRVCIYKKSFQPGGNGMCW